MWGTVLKGLTDGFTGLTWQSTILIIIGCVLLYLAVAKKIEPLLLIPIGFGVILGNLPLANLWAVRTPEGELGVISYIYEQGILTEVFPALLFVGLGAMIDFGPMLANPSVLVFGAAGQFGIFLVLLLALAVGRPMNEAASIAVIGACDGPTAIYVTSKFASNLLAPVSIAAYSYMALVPIIQPPIMRLLTTKKERSVVMPYGQKQVSKKVKLLFPIVGGLLTMLIAPLGAPLMGMLMLGNFLKEAGVVEKLVDTSTNIIANVVTLLLGLTIGASMLGGEFFKWTTILIFVLGLCAIALDTVAGVLLGKVMYFFSKGKINPLLGAAGTSAFPMSSRVVQKEGQRANPRSFLLWHAVGANTGGQIGSVMAASVMMLALVKLGY